MSTLSGAHVSLRQVLSTTQRFQDSNSLKQFFLTKARNSQHFTETEGSLPHTQQFAFSPEPDPIYTPPTTHPIPSICVFNIILPILHQVKFLESISKVSYYLQENIGCSLQKSAGQCCSEHQSSLFRETTEPHTRTHSTNAPRYSTLGQSGTTLLHF